MRLAFAPACLIASSVFAQSPAPNPAFDQAVAQLKAHIVKEGGAGLVVLVERTGVFDVVFRVKAVGTTFEDIEVKPWDARHAAIFSYAGKATDAVDGGGRLNEEPNALFVEVSGPGFNPRMTLKLPRRGEKPEIGTVLIGEKKGAAE